MEEDWTCLHFAQSNPSGPGQGDVPALLRRVASSIEVLGSIEVLDIVFSSQATTGEDDLNVTVYYVRQGD
jgi:hypothetical protein